jgi:hypothetical protein
MTGDHGLYEHAHHDRPRLEEGYTTDDNARALVVIARAITAGIDALETQPYLDFVLAGQVAGGWHNRMSTSGEWTDSNDRPRAMNWR